MATAGGPEELRFDFDAGRAPEAERTEQPSAGDRAPGAPDPAPPAAGDSAAGLQRRIGEVLETARAAKARRAPRVPAERAGEVEPPGAAGGVDGGASETTSEGALSVAAFYERIRHALAREFADEIWVVGEISGLRESRGHHYFQLADEGVSAQGRTVTQLLEVACWACYWPRIARALAEAGVSLEDGRVVRVRGRVSVWEGGSKLRFTLTALDVESLLGGIAAARRRLLHALDAEGLLEANRGLAVPLVPLRIGLVTSPGSEAHRDFAGQLERSGFAFDVRLEASLVQGAEAPAQIAAALGRLSSFSPDLAVLVRGGGARGDLAAFDAEPVARAIATAPFPVWTGIGHTGDRSVADEVANRALITPTACGEAVVAAVAAYFDEILGRVAHLTGVARARLDAAEHRLRAGASGLVRGARHQLARRSDEQRVARADLARAAGGRLALEHDASIRRATALRGAARRALAFEYQAMERRSQVLRAYDPRRQLERGWLLARDGSGRLVRTAAALEVGATLVVSFADGRARSRVEEVELFAGRSAPDHDESSEEARS